jgi:hypothetical protein
MKRFREMASVAHEDFPSTRLMNSNHQDCARATTRDGIPGSHVAFFDDAIVQKNVKELNRQQKGFAKFCLAESFSMVKPYKF